MKLFRPRKKRPSSVAVAAQTTLAGVPTSVVFPQDPASVVRPLYRPGATLGMEGYAPTVRVSRNRIRCEGCQELVAPGVRHICLHNAHHHLDTLTREECESLIAQLRALGVKDKAG